MIVSTGPEPPLLTVRNLRIAFDTEQGPVPAIDDVSFDLRAGEVLGLVGESGCGKSVTALSILGLLPVPPARILGGQILFEGVDLLQANIGDLRRIRGKRIAMIFQEPMSSLNPVFTVGDQLTETIRRHEKIGRGEAQKRAIKMLDTVGIPAAASRLDDYPHHLSGGMRQRVMIAMALSCTPSLLLADEPTTALDVTIQAQILDLLRALQSEFKMAVMLITHDLGVVAEFVDRVAVMYAGRIVETAGVIDAFERPRHPYTQGLLASLPSLDVEQERLPAIPGSVPGPGERSTGCSFAPRCGQSLPICASEAPVLFGLGGGHSVACVHHAGVPTV
jgi:oligopeptide/dipeptide ABC transporter ATP-binding protein